MSKRRKAREALIRALYISECRGISVSDAFEEMEDVDQEMLSDDPDVTSLPLEPFALCLDDAQKRFAHELAKIIEQDSDDFNEKIRAVLVNWNFERIARIDRYIFWIALAEMTSILDIPISVSINEAIELAKSYSSEKSPKFINGILDRLAKDIDA